MKYTGLPAGTKVYYRGDCANQSGFGEITRRFSNDWYSSQYDIELLDGRKMEAIQPSNFEGPGARFELHAPHMDHRRAREEAFYAQEREHALLDAPMLTAAIQ